MWVANNSAQPEPEEDIVDNAIIAPAVTDASFASNVLSDTLINDFSSHLYINADGALRRIAEDNEQTPMPNTEEDPKIVDPSSDVYMDTILNMVKSMSIKINEILGHKTDERVIMERVHRQLLLKNYREALSMLESCTSEISSSSVLCDMLAKEWSETDLEIRTRCLSMKESHIKLRNIINTCIDKITRRSEECMRLKNIINTQSEEHTAQMDVLMRENNAIKDGLHALLEKHGTKDSLKSQLEIDMLEELDRIVQHDREKMKRMEAETQQLKQKIDEYVAKEQSFEVSSMMKQNEELKQLLRQIQKENIGFSDAVQKLNEKNVKLKQDLVLFNSELKKAHESIKVKNETISRQKTLIAMFQEKLCGSEDLPIEELRKKKAQIESRIESETDVLAKQNLKREKMDCEKRLNDFISLNKRNGNL